MKLLIQVFDMLPGLPDKQFIEVKSSADIARQMKHHGCSDSYIQRVLFHVASAMRDPREKETP